MRVQSVVDIRFKLFIYAVIGAMAALSVCLSRSLMLSPGQALVGYAAVFLASALLLWLLHGTYYELHDSYLLCRSGPFTEIIPYDSIRRLSLCDSVLSSMAPSRRRIGILQQDEGCAAALTLISPAGRELFMARLKQRCVNLERSA